MGIGSMARSPALHQAGDVYEVSVEENQILNLIDILKLIFTPDVISLRVFHKNCNYNK